jgi:hypothetical protein
LKLKYGDTAFKISRCAFNFNLRRYNAVTLLFFAGFLIKPSDYPGRAVQVDPFKPKLKPPGTMRLKLYSDALLSTFAFKFGLRRYTPCTGAGTRTLTSSSTRGAASWYGLDRV